MSLSETTRQYDSIVAPIEPNIANLARSYHRRFNGMGAVDLQDLIQLGLIAAWEASSKNTDVKYLMGAASRAMGKQLVHSFRHKRFPRRGLFSLDDKMGKDSEDRTLHDVVASTIESEKTLGEIFKARFGAQYAAKLKAHPSGRLIVKKLLCKMIPESVEAKSLSVEFFHRNGFGAILSNFFNGSIERARAELFPEEYFRKGSKGDYWMGAFGAVGALWNSSDPLDLVKSEYLLFSDYPNKEKSFFIDNSRKVEVLPFRYGFAHLLLEGYDLDANYAKCKLNLKSQESVAEASKKFLEGCEERKLKLPPKAELEYSWRLICNAIAKRDWAAYKNDTLSFYSQDVGIPSEILTSSKRDTLTARARAGLFYILSEIQGKSSKEVIQTYGFNQDRSVVSYSIKSVEAAIDMWRSINVSKDEAQINSDYQLNLGIN
ncbi:MAG TPA: hypothetical protein VHA12_02055 [Candidatus Nanoarchaeia archaeon]|nr:hypothetical protein [Candidatus Nanoarchaeia archaeon]